jgi:hypothetical protein
MGAPHCQSSHVSGLQKPEVEDKEMSSAMLEKLGTNERLELLVNEKIIRDNIETTVKTWVALQIIRDKKLYRADYGSFEEYCQKKWEFSRRHADQMISGAAAIQSLPKELRTAVLTSGAVAKALVSVPEEDRVEVVRKIKKSKKPATAAAITQTAAEVAKPKAEKTAQVRCETGAVIPQELIPLWNQRDYVKKLMSAISRVKCEVEKGLETKDPLFMEVRNTYIAELNSVRSGLNLALPYALCSCNGHMRNKCLVCHGRGLLSKMRYDTLPTELKEMRKKMLEKANAK